MVTIDPNLSFVFGGNYYRGQESLIDTDDNPDSYTIEAD